MRRSLSSIVAVTNHGGLQSIYGHTVTRTGGHILCDTSSRVGAGAAVLWQGRMQDTADFPPPLMSTEFLPRDCREAALEEEGTL